MPGSMPGNDLPDRVSTTSDEFVTQVVAVKNVQAAQLVQILRPLMAQYGPHGGASRLEHADPLGPRGQREPPHPHHPAHRPGRATRTSRSFRCRTPRPRKSSRIITALYQQQGAEGGAQPVQDRRRRALEQHPGERRAVAAPAHQEPDRASRYAAENGGDTQVRYLRYADAEKIATKLKEQITGVAQAAAATGGAAAAAGPAAQAEKGTIIWADPETNALIITAPPKTMRSLMTIIDKLDIRRAQVLVEAIIVEVTQDKSCGARRQLGGVRHQRRQHDIPLGGFLSPVGGASLVDLVNAVDNPGKADLGKPSATARPSASAASATTA